MKNRKKHSSHLETAVWAISPEPFQKIMAELADSKKDLQSKNLLEQFMSWASWRDEEIEKDTPEGYELIEYEGNTFALIRLHGILAKEADGFEKRYFGIYGTADLLPVLDQIEADPSIQGLLLHIDSPGGTVRGTEILANRLYAFSKTSVALIDEQCESGAYWIAAQTNKIIASASTAQIGSIGVLMRHTDYSKENEIRGLKVNYITSDGSPDKALVNSDRPLTAEGVQSIKDMLNPIYESFVAQIRKSRRTISDSALTGKTFLAAEAFELGLIDQIGSQENALAYLSKKQISKIQNTIKMESSEKPPVVQATAQAETPPAVQDKGADMMAKMFEQMTAMSAKIATLEAKNSELDQVKVANADLKKKLEQAEQTTQTVEKQKAEAEKKLEETPVAKTELPSPTAGDSNDPLSRIWNMAVAKEGIGAVQARWNGYRENAWNKPK